MCTTPTTGALIRTLTSPNAQFEGEFGYSVAISGSILVVGAPFENVNVTDQEDGHAYTFNATTGALISNLTSPNAGNQVYGEFGWSVAISGNIVVIGAYHEFDSGDFGAGHAYMFNAISGALLITFNSSGPLEDGYFGASVAISGKFVVVGAPNETATGYIGAGHAYEFTATKGKLISTLTSSNSQAGGYFGLSVAISGRIEVVGAPNETATGYVHSGHAYTFNATTGALIKTFTSHHAQYDGYFGVSVSISGKIALVGAPGETPAHGYVFNAKTGKLIRTLTSPNTEYEELFGNSVAASTKIADVSASTVTPTNKFFS